MLVVLTIMVESRLNLSDFCFSRMIRHDLPLKPTAGSDPELSMDQETIGQRYAKGRHLMSMHA